MLCSVTLTKRDAQVTVDTVDRDNWLTVRQISESLAVSENTVRMWVNRGIVKNVAKAQRRGRNGALFWCDVFDPQEIAALDAKRRRGAPAPPTDAGEIAACAFELFDRGDEDRKVVVKLRQRPEVVSGLREQWLDMGGAQIVITQEAREALEGLLGPFEDVADLVRVVRSRVADARPAQAQAAPQ